MPTFSRSLEKALHRALAIANEHRHEYATLEHLLLALTEDKDAAAVMRACGVNVGAAFTIVPPVTAFWSSNHASSCADSSFFPIWRAIITTKVSPAACATLVKMARAAASW